MADGNILDLKTPAQDPLNDLLKHGAQQLLAKAVEAELLAQYSDLQSAQQIPFCYISFIDSVDIAAVCTWSFKDP